MLCSRCKDSSYSPHPPTRYFSRLGTWYSNRLSRCRLLVSDQFLLLLAPLHYSTLELFICSTYLIAPRPPFRRKAAQIRSLLTAQKEIHGPRPRRRKILTEKSWFAWQDSWWLARALARVSGQAGEHVMFSCPLVRITEEADMRRTERKGDGLK